MISLAGRKTHDLHFVDFFELRTYHFPPLIGCGYVVIALAHEMASCRIGEPARPAVIRCRSTCAK
jgi:hypothetical protein